MKIEFKQIYLNLKFKEKNKNRINLIIYLKIIKVKFKNNKLIKFK